MKNINIFTNKSGFEYDIHSLFKAFFTEYEVNVNPSLDKDEEIYATYNIDFLEDKIILRKLRDEETVAEYTSESCDLNSDRGVIKNILKRLIYNALSEELSISLPWGTLTGIRPTKIPMTLLNDGKEESEIRKYMKEVYLLSDEKLELSMEIAKREKALLDTINYENGYSLYIGIPFCPTTCLYCSFTSYPICSYKNKIDDYLDAVCKELDYVKDEFKDKILDSIYIGGGTPTSLDAKSLERLLKKISCTFDVSSLKEFTVEAGRPDSITREKLEVIKKYNVTRISVNPQTMNQNTLDFIGRKHTVDELKEVYRIAREVGLHNINMDIILGLPGEGAKEVSYTIDEIKKLNPESLTVHSLAIKRASKLAQWIKENGMSTLKNTDETMDIASKGAQSMGMVPYYLYRQKNMSGNFENVGYAKEGNFGIYNILIMEEVQTIIACGAGTVTKRVYGDGRIERCDNVKDVALYISKIEEMIDRKRQLFKD